jgi:hypothetical protein
MPAPSTAEPPIAFASTGNTLTLAQGSILSALC